MDIKIEMLGAECTINVDDDLIGLFNPLNEPSKHKAHYICEMIEPAIKQLLDQRVE